MEIKQNYDLTKLNTFGVSVNAKFFIKVEREADLAELLALPEFKNNKKLFLGGGSNILFTKDFDGIVVLNKLKGLEVLEEKNENVLIKAMSGEIWHDLVNFAVERECWGVENLSLIPGTVGAAPVQNIGAYGAELKDVLVDVEAYDIATGAARIFPAKECRLGYRDSIFKNELKGKYFISAITVKLSKKENKNINYKILQEYLKENKIEVKNSKDVSGAISEIRRSKLPDPKIIGNAGSFFKNVFVTEKQLLEALKKYPDLPYFKEDKEIKIPAGWLIEQCGWKGKRVGNVGTYDRQALIIVNHGGATGEEINNFAEQIIASVYAKFDLMLVPEVNLI